MRHVHAWTTILALSSCIPSENAPAGHGQQSVISSFSVTVPAGPVDVPTLPSAASPLGAGQILCDSYRIADPGRGHEVDGEDDGTSAGDIVSECVETANSFYKELQVQLVSLTDPTTLDRGLASLDVNTTFLFPDGSYTQGADAYKAARPKLFGSSPVTGIQNKFIYKPIDKDTVILIGDPTYTLGSGSTVDSVQYRVYTRRHRGEGSCRSLSKLSGQLCWGEAAGQWTYKRPFSGMSSPHAISTTRSQIPVSASYPAELEPGRSVCDGSYRQRKGDVLTCEQAAREFYKEIQFQIVTLTNPNTVSSGLAALNEATTFVYPTGLVTESVAALGANIGNLFGENTLPIGIENKFIYKPIDSETVLFIGDPMFTMLNLVTGQTKQVESVQLSIYRRNSTPLGNCRSEANPEGDVCWTELAEQWVYGQPLREE